MLFVDKNRCTCRKIECKQITGVNCQFFASRGWNAPVSMSSKMWQELSGCLGTQKTGSVGLL